MGRSSRSSLRAVPILGALSVLALPGLVYCADIRVPEDQPTLQAAVSAAASGDVILFAPGTYAGGAFVNNKYLIFESWYRFTGDTSYISRTVLTGVASNACGGQPGCARNAVLEFGPSAGGSQVIGLTLTHGENGVSSSSRVSITACHVIGNGDGVDYVSGSGGTLRNSMFAHNSDDGIDLNGDMDLTIAGNEIRDNGDDGIEYRLFAYTGPLRTVIVTGNRITGNAEDGIQIIDYPSVDSFVVRIERNYFQANFDASGSSAAIGCMGNGNSVENLSGAAVAERVYVNHNTVVGEKNGLVGGANTIAVNNIFTGIENRAVRRVGGRSVTAWSLCWNNLMNYESSVLDSASLRLGDPGLDSTGHLTAGSAAVAAGTRFYSWKGETVLNEPPGSSIDLGAYPWTPNHPPVVMLGPDRLVRPPASIRLAAQVSDDGRPVPVGMLTWQWSVLSGPAPVTLDTPGLPVTGATLTSEGIYRVRCAVSDGVLTGADTIGITVQPLGLGDFPVMAAADDAEEQASGAMSASVSDIELVGGSSQIAGLRFPAVAVPPGAGIARAYIQFVADGIQSEPTTLLVQGQAADAPALFIGRLRNISTRPRTLASVSWSPPPWTVLGEAGDAQRTPDLSPLLREILARPGWRSGNPIAFIISGSGRRIARAYEGDPAGAAVLHVEFTPEALGIGTDPPAGLELRVTRGPIEGSELEVEFALPVAHPARLELADVAGRRRVAREVGEMGAGRHRLVLAREIPAGIYFVRLTQDDRARVVKAVALRHGVR